MQTVTLLEVFAAARARQASLVPESAGYFMLALGRAMAGLPLQADPATVLLSTEGIVALAGARTKIPIDQAACGMREILAQLLEVSQGTPGSLASALEPPPPAAHPLSAFFATVTRALIPINRGAAKRALARLARETLRVADTAVHVMVAEPVPAPVPVPTPVPEPVPAAARSPLSQTIELDDIDVDVELTPSPVLATIELATPTPPPLPLERERTPSPVVATIELHTPTPSEPTPTLVDVTTSERDETRPYTFEVRDDQVALGPVSPHSIRFELPALDNATANDIDAAIEAMRALSPVGALAVAPAIRMLAEPSTNEKPMSTPPKSEPPTDLEIVERMRSDLEERAAGPRKRRPQDSRALSRVRARVAAEKVVREIDSLLDGFAGDRDGDAVAEAAAGLQHMVALELTPAVVEVPPPSPEVIESEVIESNVIESDAGPPVELDVSAPSRTPADTEVEEVQDERSFPPALVPTRARSSTRSLLVSATLLVAGLSAAGFVYVRRQHMLAAAPESERPAEVAGASPSHCFAEIELTGLPSPHEILVHLGEAPMRTRPLPIGVRLELVAMAPEHRPARLIVPADATWQDIVDNRVLRLEAKLDRGGVDPWPNAPAGEVGGVGSPGVIDFEADPKGAELWLVAGAGTGASTRVTLPCGNEARLLVIAADDPATQRRLQVPADLLRAAAESGPAQVSAGM